MLSNGLNKILPNGKDYSVVHTFGAILDPKSIPNSFSIYGGQIIPNQNQPDTRFNPPVEALPFACVGETLAFDTEIKTGKLFDPYKFYMKIPPGIDGQGRDIRVGMQTLIDQGIEATDGTIVKDAAYFNCYGTGDIDDFDAAVQGLYLNSLQDQKNKRGVIVGTWWYPEFENTLSIDGKIGVLPTPSFDTRTASLHCHLIVGKDSTYKDDYLEDISWQGMGYGDIGRNWISRETYNALMAQPYTGAFTIASLDGNTPVSIGVQAQIDHFVYFFRNSICHC